MKVRSKKYEVEKADRSVSSLDSGKQELEQRVQEISKEEERTAREEGVAGSGPAGGARGA